VFTPVSLHDRLLLGETLAQGGDAWSTHRICLIRWCMSSAHMPSGWSSAPRKTLAWMMGGLRQSGWISLTAWPPYVVSRARDAQRTVRRFRRWLDNDKIAVLSLYGPLLQQALAEWGEQAL